MENIYWRTQQEFPPVESRLANILTRAMSQVSWAVPFLDWNLGEERMRELMSVNSLRGNSLGKPNGEVATSSIQANWSWTQRAQASGSTSFDATSNRQPICV